jgi:hypothetical protein
VLGEARPDERVSDEQGREDRYGPPQSIGNHDANKIGIRELPFLSRDPRFFAVFREDLVAFAPWRSDGRPTTARKNVTAAEFSMAGIT